MEALIVDTPFIRVYQLIRTKPQIENKEKIMPPVITSLLKMTLSSCSRGYDKAKAKKTNQRSMYPNKFSVLNFVSIVGLMSSVNVQNMKEVSLVG